MESRIADLERKVDILKTNLTEMQTLVIELKRNIERIQKMFYQKEEESSFISCLLNMKELVLYSLNLQRNQRVTYLEDDSPRRDFDTPYAILFFEQEDVRCTEWIELLEYNNFVDANKEYEVISDFTREQIQGSAIPSTNIILVDQEGYKHFNDHFKGRMTLESSRVILMSPGSVSPLKTDVYGEIYNPFGSASDESDDMSFINVSPVLDASEVTVQGAVSKPLTQ